MYLADIHINSPYIYVGVGAIDVIDCQRIA